MYLWFTVGALLYKASSPDEEALVGAARDLGWVFHSRRRDNLTVLELGVTREYQLLAQLEFTSQRRRMSILGEGALLHGVTLTLILTPTAHSVHSGTN